MSGVKRVMKDLEGATVKLREFVQSTTESMTGWRRFGISSHFGSATRKSKSSANDSSSSASSSGQSSTNVLKRMGPETEP